MRTPEQHARAMDEVRNYHRLHGKAVWLVPRADDYRISVIKPLSADLPEGTAAVLYDLELNVVDQVDFLVKRPEDNDFIYYTYNNVSINGQLISLNGITVHLATDIIHKICVVLGQLAQQNPCGGQWVRALDEVVGRTVGFADVEGALASRIWAAFAADVQLSRSMRMDGTQASYEEAWGKPVKIKKPRTLDVRDSVAGSKLVVRVTVGPKMGPRRIKAYVGKDIVFEIHLVHLSVALTRLTDMFGEADPALVERLSEALRGVEL